jgi:hypothetical protein
VRGGGTFSFSQGGESRVVVSVLQRVSPTGGTGGRIVKRIALPVVALITLLLAISVMAAPALAQPPDTFRFPIEEDFVDEGASAACGFPVTVHLEGFVVGQVTFDETGEPIRFRFVTNATGTISGNGISLPEADRTVTFVDVADETVSEIGIVFRVSALDGGVVIFDRGRLVFDESAGVLLFEAGPHPGLDGEFNALCAALTP